MKNAFICFISLISIVNTSCKWDLHETQLDLIQPHQFTCGDTFVDERDAKSYRTVKLGNQCWFADDLAYNSGGNGMFIPPTDTCTIPASINLSGSIANSGYVYSWMEVETGSGICPSGWHVASDAEWLVMEANYLEISPHRADHTALFDFTGAAIRGICSCHPGSPRGMLIDTFFINTFPGRADNNGNVSNQCLESIYWTSTGWSNGKAISRKLVVTGNVDGLSRDSTTDKSQRLSVKCIQD